MVVGCRIDEMAENFLLGPFSRRGANRCLGIFDLAQPVSNFKNRSQIICDGLHCGSTVSSCLCVLVFPPQRHKSTKTLYLSYYQRLFRPARLVNSFFTI